MKTSPFMIQVLSALREAEHKGTFNNPSSIADKIFPADHPGWQRCCKCGPYGSHRGSGLVMFMGGYIGKLRRAGLVSKFQNILTPEGRKVLKDAKV